MIDVKLGNTENLADDQVFRKHILVSKIVEKCEDFMKRL